MISEVDVELFFTKLLEAITHSDSHITKRDTTLFWD